MCGEASRLGLKLPLTWREQQRRGELPLVGGQVYPFLREQGLRFVEFAVGACTEQEVELLRREAGRCRRAGLGLALHPYLGGAANPARFGTTAESTAALDAVLSAGTVAVSRAGEPAVLNLHPAESDFDPGAVDPGGYRAELLERSRTFFAEIEGRLGGHPGLEVVVEHQVPPAPEENLIRIGDTWPELLSVVRDTGLGLCWDTGHFLLSVERHGQGAEPSGQFLERVRHVHLHDVVEGRDHRPVGRDSEQVRRCLGMLRRPVSVTLEYALEAIEAAGGVERVLHRSVALLGEWGIV